MSRPKRRRQPPQEIYDLEDSDGTDESDLEEYDSAEDSPGSLEDFIVGDDEDIEDSDYTYSESDAQSEFTDSDESENEQEECHELEQQLACDYSNWRMVRPPDWY